MKLFHINSGKTISCLKDFHLSEAGIMPIFDIKEIKDTSLIEKEICEHNNYCALLGSDHSVTYSAFKAFAKQNLGAGIILFDSHAGHDCLKKLVDEKILDKNNIVLVGTRNVDKQEKKFIDENKLKVYSMREISLESIREVADSVMSVARQWSKAYISIDMDVLDPAFAPGTGYPEPGGMSTRELIYFIQRLKMLRNLGMADVVDVNPDKDVNDMTSKVAAKLITELS